jgi:undecaprenyldiphospho-muramoylpentapeptide beta-N-acetylglucosaminyltransferase
VTRRSAAPAHTYALVAGGGTAGHVLPGIAIADALVRAGHPRETVAFVGSRRGVEARLVPAAGYDLVLLPGRGIQRRLTLANVGAVAGLVAAGFQALILVARRRPRVVVALGGYASVACAIAAWLLRVPIVVAEQNARPGAANRLVSRFAKVAAVSFPDTPLPRAVVTGNPVRAEVLAVDAEDPDQIRAELGIEPGRKVLLVFGGSLGALRVNRAVFDALDSWAGREDLAVRHVVGERDWPLVATEVAALPAGGLQYQPLRYDDAMARSLRVADLAVTRAGSSSLFELATLGVPAVVVPSPHVTADHHNANASHLVDAGAAVVVPDAELTGGRLVAEVDALLADPARRGAMASAIRGFARPDAADHVVSLVEEHARA